MSHHPPQPSTTSVQYDPVSPAPPPPVNAPVPVGVVVAQPLVSPVQVYTPVNSPVFAQVQAIQLPEQYKGSSISPELWGIIHASDEFTIRQHVKVLPKACCKCPPVIQENTYSVYFGNSTGQAEVLRIDEVSDDWNRCCCKPYHPLKLEVRQHIPLPGDDGQSDYSHVSADIQRDFAGFANDRVGRYNYVRDFYQRNPVLFTIVRNDGQRCCCKMPCKWLNTFVCFSCCQDGAHLYAGQIPNDPKEAGRPLTEQVPAPLIGSVTQPIFGGCCIPFLELRDSNDEAAPFGKVAGPCFFGGWSEMCFSFAFPVSYFNSDRSSGDIGTIVKKKPSNMTQAAVELCSDADWYGIKFNEANLSKITAEQKLTVLSSQLLLDYMLFDGNTEKCKSTDDAIYCYCCYFSLLGHLCPCFLVIPTRSG